MDYNVAQGIWHSPLPAVMPSGVLVASRGHLQCARDLAFPMTSNGQHDPRPWVQGPAKLKFTCPRMRMLFATGPNHGPAGSMISPRGHSHNVTQCTPTHTTHTYPLPGHLYSHPTRSRAPLLHNCCVSPCPAYRPPPRPCGWIHHTRTQQGARPVTPSCPRPPTPHMQRI